MAFVVFFAACKHVTPRAIEIAALAGDPEAGAEPYGQHCTDCHGADGKGTERAMHGDKPVNFTTAAHYYRAEVFITMIIDGVPGTDMAPWGQLGDQEIADVYAHILSLPRD